MALSCPLHNRHLVSNMFGKSNRNTYRIVRTAILIIPTPKYYDNIKSWGPWQFPALQDNTFHRNAGSCWFQRFPQLAGWLEVGWRSFGWWTILDTHRKLLSVKTAVACSSWHKPVHLAPTTIPHSKGLKYYAMPIDPLNGTHAQSMSQLSKGSKILL